MTQTRRGEPRIDYARLYVLLPPPCGVEWAKAAIDALWDDYRPTIGGSADDAGIGNLEERRVLAVNPDLWPSSLEAFFAEWYPGVVVLPVYADTPNHLKDLLTGSEPPPPPPPPVVGVPTSLHWQKRIAYDIEFMQQVKPAVAKTVMNIEFCHWIKEVSPETTTVFRQWLPDQGEYLKMTDGPRRWLETCLDALHQSADVVDYCESLNEVVATGDTEGIKRAVDFDVRFCEELEQEGYPARPCILNVAVGNPQHGAETDLLIPAARASVDHGGVIGYHTYWGSAPDGYCTMDEHFEHYAGRALMSWDPVFRAHGIYPRYIFGEAGAVWIGDGGWLNPNAGWKDACRSFDHYIEQILEFQHRIDKWNAEHDGRALGFTLFTCGGGNQWKRFELNGYLDRLADALT